MSQASGAARETSMDEILASIRKIIEESDAAASAAEAEGAHPSRPSGSIDLAFDPSDLDEDDADDAIAGFPTVLDADDQIDDEIVAAGEAELNAFREAISDRGPAGASGRSNGGAEAAAPASAAPRKPSTANSRGPLSLADIQAKLSSQADDLDAGTVAVQSSENGFGPDEEVADDPDEEVADDKVTVDTMDETPPVEPLADVDAVGETAPPEAEEPVLQALRSEAPATAASHSIPSEDRFRAVAEKLERRPLGAQPPAASLVSTEDDAADPVSSSNASGLAPIVSREAGKAVADSFGQLKDAFFASRQRDFDQMAEEMLRPMLQDWLDNNLPTLVERLVKEEIERIAQGG